MGGYGRQTMEASVLDYVESSHARFTAPAIGLVGGPTETACNSWTHSLGIGVDVYRTSSGIGARGAPSATPHHYRTCMLATCASPDPSWVMGERLRVDAIESRCCKRSKIRIQIPKIRLERSKIRIKRSKIRQDRSKIRLERSKATHVVVVVAAIVVVIVVVGDAVEHRGRSEVLLDRGRRDQA